MKVSTQNNGGFPPLILKNNNKTKNNKERLIASNIINIRQMLQTKKSKNILDKLYNEKNNLEIVTSL